jgi:hypothetical protein
VNVCHGCYVFRVVAFFVFLLQSSCCFDCSIFVSTQSKAGCKTGGKRVAHMKRAFVSVCHNIKTHADSGGNHIRSDVIHLIPPSSL